MVQSMEPKQYTQVVTDINSSVALIYQSNADKPFIPSRHLHNTVNVSNSTCDNLMSTSESINEVPIVSSEDQVNSDDVQPSQHVPPVMKPNVP